MTVTVKVIVRVRVGMRVRVGARVRVRVRSQSSQAGRREEHAIALASDALLHDGPRLIRLSMLCISPA